MPAGVDAWLAAHPVVLRIDGDDPDRPVRHLGHGAPGQILSLVTEAVAAGRWSRLKACPDCRHVFYDHSRHRSRTWCGMYTVDGRACGSIAKVRRHRSRRAGGHLTHGRDALGRSARPARPSPTVRS